MNNCILISSAVIFLMAVCFLVALILIRRHYEKEFEDLREYRRFRFMQLNLKNGDWVCLIEAKPLYRGRYGMVVNESKDGRLLVRFEGLTAPIWCDRSNLMKAKKYGL